MISPAYFEDDIIWNELNYDQGKGITIYLFSFFILWICSVVIITPVSLYSVVQTTTRIITYNNTFAQVITDTLKNAASPLSLLLCNSLIIPLLVDLVAMC
jgi:hypothetical protein